MDTRNKKKAVIIGCGINGVMAAKRLKELDYEVIILEKNKVRVGGKHKSIMGQEISKIALTSNDPALELIAEKSLQVEKVLIEQSSYHAFLYAYTQPTFIEKLLFTAKLSTQCSQFIFDTWRYNKTYDETYLAPQYFLDFKSYVKAFKLTELAKYMQICFPNFNCGAFASYPVYHVMNHIGYSAFSLSLNKLLGKHTYYAVGGYQKLVERMAKDMDVRMGVEIDEIKRERNKVTITFYDNAHSYVLNPCYHKLRSSCVNPITFLLGKAEYAT